MDVSPTKNRRGAKRSSTIEGPVEHRSKRPRENDNNSDTTDVVGKIKRIFMRNFMCHDNLEIELNENVNFIVGPNGSGKSAILTAITVGLGAKANMTKRGSSIKDLIKKGKKSAEVRISLLNEGPAAYRPDTYGNIITIQRTIGNTSSYKIKNSKGGTVSTKRSELDDILLHMNIQIDNPISVMNQDVSRTFLVASKPNEKYELFMKASQLDVIGTNYKQAAIDCIRVTEDLKNANTVLAEREKEVSDLEMKLEMCEKIEESRKQVKDLEVEFHWAAVLMQERKYEKCEDHLKKCINELKSIEESTNTVGSRSKEIDEEIENLKTKIKELECEAADKNDAHNTFKKQSTALKESLHVKVRELQNNEVKVKRTVSDIAMLRKEISKLEGGDAQEQNRAQLKKLLTELEQKLDETEAMFRTKQTDQMHLEADKIRLQQEVHTATIEVQRYEKHIYKTNQELNVLKQQSDNALTVFNPNMPRLLKRIEEEYKNGQFKQKPRGPLGAYIKMKDIKWAPAVENFFGADFLNSFCVDNSQDAKVLKALMSEVYLHERMPQVNCSKFYYQVHNVHNKCTRAPGYSNLLEAMDITDPVVANCIIDQREVECLLLIPTNKEACHMMSHVSRVPRNCKRALTQDADTFFPDPHYRSYGGKRGLRAKFLQVSTKDVIQTLQEELSVNQDERKAAMTNLTTIRDKLDRTISEFNVVCNQVGKLRAKQNELKTQIGLIQDRTEQNDTASVTILRDELVVLESKLQKDKQEVERLNDMVKELQNKIQNAEIECSKYTDMAHKISLKIEPVENEIRKLSDEKRMLHLKNQHVARKIDEHKQAVQKAEADVKLQECEVKKAVTKAEKYGPRVDTQRSINEIKELSAGLKLRIQEVEQQAGIDTDELKKLLRSKRKAQTNAIEFAEQLEISNEKHKKRLKMRRKMFQEMKFAIAHKVRESFESILALRQYKGTMQIDHTNRVLDLHVTPNVNSEKMKNTKTLSGGERSYATVAFILALWECTGLPFYFLDEFDVFMDKINRHTIMEILLNHTKEHPECQFTFLTPLDTSNILTEDYVTIHQMAEPERNNEMDQA